MQVVKRTCRNRHCRGDDGAAVVEMFVISTLTSSDSTDNQPDDKNQRSDAHLDLRPGPPVRKADTARRPHSSYLDRHPRRRIPTQAANSRSRNLEAPACRRAVQCLRGDRGPKRGKAAAAPLPPLQNGAKHPLAYRLAVIVGQKRLHTTRMAHDDENSPAGRRAKWDKTPQPERCGGVSDAYDPQSGPNCVPGAGTRAHQDGKDSPDSSSTLQERSQGC